jgi:hypothetical protein
MVSSLSEANRCVFIGKRLAGRQVCSPFCGNCVAFLEIGGADGNEPKNPRENAGWPLPPNDSNGIGWGFAKQTHC